MRFSKLSSILCALAVGTIGFTIRAQDNPAQAAARIALAKQLFEASAPPATNAPAANAVGSKEAKAKAKADKAAAEAQAKQAAAQAAAEAKARQDADKKLADQQAAQARAAAAIKAQEEKDAAAKAKQDAAKKLADQQASQAKAAAEPAKAQAATNNAAASAAANTEAKAGKEQKETPPKAAPAGQTAAAPQPGSRTGNSYQGADLGLKPIAPPPLPISASKADRLAALLRKYQADQVTPQEYHQQRAAILAEP